MQVYVKTASPAGTADVLVDVVGYTVGHTHDDRYYTDSEVDTLIGAIPAGPPGAQGAPGAPGEDAPRPEHVIWVAESGCDFTTLAAAMASIDGADVDNRFVIKIAPGVYSESEPVLLKSYVDVEGSGRGVTEITCACASNSEKTGAVLIATLVVAEVRHLTVSNTGGGTHSAGVYVRSDVEDSFSLLHVDAVAGGGSERNVGVFNGCCTSERTPAMSDVSASATGGISSYGVYNNGSSAMMTNVVATATGGSTWNQGVHNGVSAPLMTNVIATASGEGTSRNAAVYNSDASPRISNLEASASGGASSYGLYNWEGTMRVRGSSIEGGTYSITNYGSVRVADSRLDGPISGDGSFTCIGAYTDTFVALGTNCT